MCAGNELGHLQGRTLGERRSLPVSKQGLRRSQGWPVSLIPGESKSTPYLLSDRRPEGNRTLGASQGNHIYQHIQRVKPDAYVRIPPNLFRTYQVINPHRLETGDFFKWSGETFKSLPTYLGHPSWQCNRSMVHCCTVVYQFCIYILHSTIHVKI